MFIKVKLLTGFKKILTYKVPKEWGEKNLVGKIVRVPIRTKEASAVVLHQHNFLKKENKFELRMAKSIEQFPDDKTYHRFIEKLCNYHQLDKLHFLRRIRGFLDNNISNINDFGVEPVKEQYQNVELTEEQQTVVDFFTNQKNSNTKPTVLHGVTSSGKTEIYKNLIIKTIENAKTAILLLPEVTLAIQFENLMRKQLPKEILIFGFHSGTSVKNKKIAWNKLVKKVPILIIGVHIPVLLPIANLGFIIVDEEHESGYQEKKHPKINSKDAAIIRACENKIPILLGSATPSLSSLYNIKTKDWFFFQLKKRFSGNFPQIKTVLLGDKNNKKSGSFWISKQLENAIKNKMNKREQIIIFLNRRGFSFFVQCKNCSFIFSCPNCSVSLTLHKDGKLHCHYCQYEILQPQTCPQCNKKEFLKKGIGTQQVVAILEKIFPYARIARADLDTSSKKKVWQKTMEEFEAGCIDILVGTQTISKGFHFPRVTLVGVLWADLNLHFPIYNATEKTLQQIIQVAGRAGRNHEKSEVIIQTMSMNPVFDYLSETDYLKFYSDEIEKRKLLGYPPYKRLVEIELKNTNEAIVEREAAILALTFSEKIKKNNFAIQILGPSKPPISKIKNIHIRKIYIKGKNINLIGKIYNIIDKLDFLSKIFFTPNPLN